MPNTTPAERQLYEGIWNDIDELLTHALALDSSDNYRQGRKDALRVVRDKFSDRWREFRIARKESEDAEVDG